MRKNNADLLMILGFCALVAWRGYPLVRRYVLTPPTPNKTSPAQTASAFVDHPGQTSTDYMAEIRTHLYQEKFSLLDKLAPEVRAKKERFPGGAWKLFVFYAGLNTPPDGTNASEQDWQAHLEKLRKWERQIPDSFTARVAMGDALMEYAWKVRGNGFADTVTTEKWKLFGERMAMAAQSLASVSKSRSQCPHWYLAMLRVSLGVGLRRSLFNRLFDEAITVEPGYYYFYRVKAIYLMPRWQGSPGDWERFAEETYQKVGGKEGAMLYYLIASHMHTFCGVDLFKESHISWIHMKQGFGDLEADYGMSMSRLNEGCLMAALAGDRATAKLLFGRIGESWDASAWKSKANFDVYKAWAHYSPKS